MACSIVATTIFLTAKPLDTKGAPCNMCNTIAATLKIACWDLSEIEIITHTHEYFGRIFTILHSIFFPQAITYKRFCDFVEVNVPWLSKMIHIIPLVDMKKDSALAFILFYF